MKYISIDIETTGLDPSRHQILQIACVLEDTKNSMPLRDLPTLVIWVAHDYLNFSPGALRMHNGEFIERYTREDQSYIHRTSVVDEIKKWLIKNKIAVGRSGLYEFNVAGKNFNYFDRRFLERLPYWDNWLKAKRRVLDPAILYTDWNNDDSLPSLGVSLLRAGFVGEVKHDAYDDALDVIRVLRPFYGGDNER